MNCVKCDGVPEIHSRIAHDWDARGTCCWCNGCEPRYDTIRFREKIAEFAQAMRWFVLEAQACNLYNTSLLSYYFMMSVDTVRAVAFARAVREKRFSVR